VIPSATTAILSALDTRHAPDQLIHPQTG
jgi:hypothetical protein